MPGATLGAVADGARKGGTGGVGRISGRGAPAERGACVSGGTTSRSTLTADAFAPGMAGVGCLGGGDTYVTRVGCNECMIEV